MENDASDMNCVACEEPRPAKLGGATYTQQAQAAMLSYKNSAVTMIPGGQPEVKEEDPFQQKFQQILSLHIAKAMTEPKTVYKFAIEDQDANPKYKIIEDD